jgi:hypothetical protein
VPVPRRFAGIDGQGRGLLSPRAIDTMSVNEVVVTALSSRCTPWQF